MKKDMIKALDGILENFQREENKGEEDFIHLIREIILQKYKIKYDAYIEFLNRNFNEPYEVIKENIFIDKIPEKFIKDLDLLTLCSILEEYIGGEKRELTGSYYTPLFIIEFMVLGSIKLYLEENTKIHIDRLEKLIYNGIIENISCEQLVDMLHILKKLRVIDIACGSGLFLHYFLQKLYGIKALIYKELNYDTSEYEEKKWILENNIFGIDIQKIPLEMVALKAIDTLGNFKEFNLDSLNLNFYKRDSILGEEIYTISKLNEIVKEEGFDIVIGNPPYVGEKGNKNIFENIKSCGFGKKYYEGKMDYFYYFIYRGVELLRENGILSYITTNYFITADGAKKLRKFLKNNVSFKNIINFNEYGIFKSASGQHNMIFTVTKGAYEDKTIDIKYIKNPKLRINEIIETINDKKVNNQNISGYVLNNQSDLYEENGNIMIFPNGKYSDILKKIKSSCNLILGDLCNINQGIVSGADRVTKRMLNQKLTKENIEKNNIEIDRGIFVLKKEEILNKNIDICRLLKPFYKNSDIKKYFTNNDADKYILYFTDKNILNSEGCFIIQDHLKKYKDVLGMRRETKKGIRNWFALQWSREQSIFEGPKIVVPHRALKNNFGYNEQTWYASADVYFITTKEKDTNIKLILSILNSKIIYFWLYNRGKRKGDYLELYSTPLAEIPINLNLGGDSEKYIIDMITEILNCCNAGYNQKLIEEYQDKIDRELYRFFKFTKEEIDYIEKLYR